MESGINVPFFLILLITVVACTIVAFVVEAIARGNGGKVTYVFTCLVALVGAFLSIHWDYLDQRTIGDLVLHGALASTIVMGLFISAIGSGLGKWMYSKCAKAIDSATAPVWKKEEGEAALTAVQNETDVNVLNEMARDGVSYRVRSLAKEKLGRHQAAQYEVARNSADEAECLAALDKVEWDGFENLLVMLAKTSPMESVALRAVEKAKDDDSLAEIATGARNEKVATNALVKIGDVDVLSEACGHMECDEAMVPSVFEKGRDLGDVELCVKVLNAFVKVNAGSVVASLATIDDAEFLKTIVTQWLGTAENPLEISERLKGKAIVEPAIAKDLEDYCCPDGCLHDLEDTSYAYHADTDERYGKISCKRCGYAYTVDGSVQLFGENCGYTFRPSSTFEWLMSESKQVVCKPGGYRCASCREYVQPADDGPAPCICPCCGAEHHDWKHYDGEIVHRDYSSGMSYDYCTRCGKKKNIVDHNTW